MTTEQQQLKAAVEAEQKLAGTWVEDHDLPRYYVWVERPRTPDFEGGEQPIAWTRSEEGGHL